MPFYFSIILLLVIATLLYPTISFQIRTPYSHSYPRLGFTNNNYYTMNKGLLFSSPTKNTRNYISRIIINSSKTSEMLDINKPSLSISFSHVQFYVDHINDVKIYKDLEDRLNQLELKKTKQESFKKDSYRYAGMDIEANQHLWDDIIIHHIDDESKSNNNNSISVNDSKFIPQNRDLVKQLISGLGFRVTGERFNPNYSTRNLLLTSKDPKGIQFIISCADHQDGDMMINKQDFGIESDLRSPSSSSSSSHDFIDNFYDHFDNISHIHEFFDSHSHRQGIATLGFQITSGTIESLYENYQRLHPKLLLTNKSNNNSNKPGIFTYHDKTLGETIKVMEVYAYYKNEKGGDVDYGTRLRFVQRMSPVTSNDDVMDKTDSNKVQVTNHQLPGFKPVDAIYDESSMPAYCDHWVSNVVSRTGFIETLHETIGFTTKVDFNAGVVAAGEAQIESTVIGNNSQFATIEQDLALKDQSQVYLPINNALSEVGHVYGFLQEIGQGIQHIASRVNDLPAFVQRANDYRKITGEGFTFLKIPRSYYGVLSIKLLVDLCDISTSLASSVFDACKSYGILSAEGAVDLGISSSIVQSALDSKHSSNDLKMNDEFMSKKDSILDAIMQSRYINLKKLLGDHLTEDTYLAIVRNQILVDVQGNDLLFQIFTSNILQRDVNHEAPFLEFIQRVCSECMDPKGSPLPIKPGCGGFGIRNFLTLFLSIEVGKAMVEVSRADEIGDTKQRDLAQKKVDLFTDQLNEANPILTSISDAMTEEGDALVLMQLAAKRDDKEEEALYREKMETARLKKIHYNQQLMSCSAKYNNLMKQLRENGL